MYHVLLDTGAEVDAVLRGRLKLEERTGDRVVTGDRVYVAQQTDGRYTIENVAQRKSELARRAPGQGAQRAKVVVANVDQVAIMFAAARPEPHLRMLDRLLILAETNDLPSLILVNKIDLTDRASCQDLFSDYERAGYSVLFMSVRESIGLADVSSVLCRRETVLTGPSGAGKSSLLNFLEPNAQLRTGAISDAVQKGRHTTVAAQLIPLSCGGHVVDTPGLREVGLWGVDAETLDVCFPEFRPILGDCRFGASCSHLQEPDCAVRAGVEAGEISRARYESYRDLRLEA